MGECTIQVSHSSGICQGLLCMAEMAMMRENVLFHRVRQALGRHEAFLDDDIRWWCAVPPGGRSPSRLAPGNRV